MLGDGSSHDLWRERARAFHAANAIADTLVPWAPGFLPAGADLVSVLDRFRAVGVRYLSLTVAAGVDGPEVALREIALRRRELASAADRYAVIGDSRATLGSLDGPTRVDFHFQSGTPFARSPELAEAYAALGVRQALIAYNERNLLGDGCHERQDSGLSRLGVAVVRAMNRSGVIVDVSHCGEATARDAIDTSEAPAIISHSNCRTLHDHERNVSDALIRACAARGGFVGINGVGMFLGAADHELERECARHICHVAELAGPDKVGFASDFMFLEGSDYGFYHSNPNRFTAGYPPPPWPFLPPERFPELTARLLACGFGEHELRGIYGGNYLRVADAAWALKGRPSR
jgi:membrane dipeptidase